MEIKIGDKVFVEGVVHSLSENSSDVEVETCLGDVDYYSADKVRSDDKQIMVPEYVKNDLDAAITSELDSLDVARVYLNDGMMFSLDTKLWIDKHRTAFMHALVDGYKVETTKKYYVKVPSTGDFYYWKPYLNNRAVLSISNNKDSSYDEKQFTMDEIKEYGLENFERVEVQDD